MRPDLRTSSTSPSAATAASTSPRSVTSGSSAVTLPAVSGGCLREAARSSCSRPRSCRRAASRSLGTGRCMSALVRIAPTRARSSTSCPNGTVRTGAAVHTLPSSPPTRFTESPQAPRRSTRGTLHRLDSHRLRFPAADDRPWSAEGRGHQQRGGMPSFGGWLTKAQIDAVSQYVLQVAGKGKSGGGTGPKRPYTRAVPGAPLDDSGSGLAPAGDGWFVVNVRDAQWLTSENGGKQRSGSECAFESQEFGFPQLGIRLHVLPPGEPNGLDHSDSKQ